MEMKFLLQILLKAFLVQCCHLGVLKTKNEERDQELKKKNRKKSEVLKASKK